MVNVTFPTTHCHLDLVTKAVIWFVSVRHKCQEWTQASILGYYPRKVMLVVGSNVNGFSVSRACTDCDHLLQLTTGLEWSTMALSRETANPQSLLSRCHLYLGIGYSLQAAATFLKHEKQQLVTHAFDAFHRWGLTYFANNRLCFIDKVFPFSFVLCVQHRSSIPQMTYPQISPQINFYDDNSSMTFTLYMSMNLI